MSFNDLDQSTQDFLLQLYRHSKGDITFQASMFEIGDSLGLDREASSKVAEELIGWEMVEIRTLSGGIGISEDAVREIETEGFVVDSDQSDTTALGSDAVINSEVRQAVEDAAGAIKNEAGGIGLAFDILAELMADLKTIDAQMASPRPKTAVIRECFLSLKNLLASADRCDSLAAVKALLKE
jgi:hypothetical protein